MVAKSAPRIESKGSEYHYRRSSLNGPETVRALGVGIVAGMAAFYIARIWLQRTPLVPPDDPRLARRRIRSLQSGGG